MRTRAASTRAGRMRSDSGNPSHASRRLVLRLRELRWLLRVMAPRPPSGSAGRAGSLPRPIVLTFLAFRRSARRRLPALRPAILFLDAGVDLFPVNLDLGRSLDAQLHLPGSDLENRDLDRVPDPNVLA